MSSDCALPGLYDTMRDALGCPSDSTMPLGAATDMDTVANESKKEPSAMASRQRRGVISLGSLSFHADLAASLHEMGSARSQMSTEL